MCIPVFIIALFTIAKMEATQVPTKRWLEKEYVVHTYNGMSLCHKKRTKSYYL